MNRFLILFLFLYFRQSFGNLFFRINIETVLRNTVDEGLVLTSEYHFSRTALASEIFREEIYEKIFLEMSAKFAAIGATPSPKISSPLKELQLMSDFLQLRKFSSQR